MPLGGVFRLRQEVEELGHAFIGALVFTLHHPQARPADDGVLRRALHVGIVRHHAHAVVEFGVVADIRQRAGRGGGNGAIAVVELLGGFVFTPEVAEVTLLVEFFQQRDVLHLLRLVELQYRVGAVEAVVFGRHRQAVPGAEVFDLDPALPAAGVAALHSRRFQLRGVFGQVLPGFWRLLRV